ncbi:hypothetical protein ACA910_015286 [Epithemia clementina (nom. ined.)]
MALDGTLGRGAFEAESTSGANWSATEDFRVSNADCQPPDTELPFQEPEDDAGSAPPSPSSTTLPSISNTTTEGCLPGYSVAALGRRQHLQ